MNIWELQQATNVEPTLDEETSRNIAREAVQGYRTDKQSRLEWDRRMEEANKLALQVKEEKNFPWRNASNVKFPLVTIGALQFQARAYPTLVRAPNAVKYRVTGMDPNGVKAARASRISTHMSYQLLDEDEHWEEEMDALMVVLPITGCAFKKSYFDSVEGMNCSKLVLPKNLIVSYYTKSIDRCERKTEEFMLSEREVTVRQKREIYSDKDLGRAITRENQEEDRRQGLVQPANESKPARPLLEQHTWLDLDKDGIEEPYVLVIDESSEQLLRIAPRFEEVETQQTVALKALTDQYKAIEQNILTLAQQAEARANQVAERAPERAIEITEAAQAQVLDLRGQQDELRGEMETLAADNEASPKVLQVKAREHYTKYTFIPSPDGGFYDLGLGSLLGPLNASVNTLINQLVDAGTMQVGSRGFLGRGARIQGGKVEFRSPYEWKRVNVSGSTLRDSMVPLPVNPPSPVLFELLGLLISYTERVSSVTDMMSGENPGQNTPAFNYNSMLEQGMQVFNGIFKRVYRSFRQELRKLYLLNRDYLNPVDYFETIGGIFQVNQEDYQSDERHVVPAADPNAFSNSEKMTKAMFLAERSTVKPGYNLDIVERQLLEAMDIGNVQEVYPTNEQGQAMIQPPPNPEIELKKAEEARRTWEAQKRYEVQAFEAETEANVADAQIVKTMVEAQSIESGDALERFRTITERQEKRREDFMKSIELEIKAEEANTRARQPAKTSD